MQDFEELIRETQAAATETVAVACADHAEILDLVQAAKRDGIADFILVGDEARIRRLTAEHGFAVDCEIVNEPDHAKAAAKAVELVKTGRACTLMKGMLHSSLFLKAILNKEHGLNAGRRITQVSVVEKEGGGFLLITDCAISIAPTLEEKVNIINNAVELAQSLGVSEPKVALLAPVEVVNPEMPETVDAAVLSKMAERGQIKNCLVDGPLALDNAISPEAARDKGIESPVAGCADILVVPNLGVGNALSKSITYIAKKTVVAATVGAAVPVVFTSRTESKQGKIATLALTIHHIRMTRAAGQG